MFNWRSKLTTIDQSNLSFTPGKMALVKLNNQGKLLVLTNQNVVKIKLQSQRLAHILAVLRKNLIWLSVS